MNSTLWILIYSKFSPACKTLLDFINQSSLDISFKLLEIDNKEIRKRVLNDKRFSIRNVPTIVSITSAGIASQYEGEKAYELVMAMANVQHANVPVNQNVQHANVPVNQNTQHANVPVNQNVQHANVQHANVQARNIPIQSQQHIPIQSQNTPVQSQHIPMQTQKTITENPQLSFSENTEEPKTITMIEDLIDEVENNNDVAPSKFDSSVGASIKGEKISASSVMANMQKTDINPRIAPTKNGPLEREDAPKQTGSKVNISSIMAASRA